jgi:transcription initiation factor TFIIB
LISPDRGNIEEEYSLHEEEVRGCPLCSQSDFIYDPETGEVICKNCGYVAKSVSVDRGPEWRAFSPEESNSLQRTGKPMKLSFHDRGLSTMIDWTDKDSSGKSLDQDTASRFNRLRKWNKQARVQDNKNRNMSQAFNVMSHISEELQLPSNVVETGALLYRQALKEEATKGRRIETVALACLYMACRICGISRGLKSFADAGGVSLKDLSRNYRFLHQLLDKDVPQIDSEKIVSKLTSQLDLSLAVEKVTLDILKAASKKKTTMGKTPSGVAASCIYIACRVLGAPVTQQQIAVKANVTEVTVRNVYKKLSKSILIEQLI